MRETILSFLLTKLKEKSEEQGIEFSENNINEEFNFLTSGVYDSIGLLELFSDIESEFEVQIDFSKYTPQEFTNLFKLIDIIILLK